MFSLWPIQHFHFFLSLASSITNCSTILPVVLSILDNNIVDLFILLYKCVAYTYLYFLSYKHTLLNINDASLHVCLILAIFVLSCNTADVNNTSL